jgi:hypothetical protein
MGAPAAKAAHSRGPSQSGSPGCEIRTLLLVAMKWPLSIRARILKVGEVSLALQKTPLVQPSGSSLLRDADR